MRERNLTSIFAEEINKYLDHMIILGYKEISYRNTLNLFDRFCTVHALSSPVFTRELADQWIKKRDGEADKTHYSRINATKNFLIYLANKKYDVYITKDIKCKPTQFKPHIYTMDEVERYFDAVDSFDSPSSKKHKIQFPLLFRILYCCGTRINETLSIRKNEVDLDAGVIKLSKTKNSKERYIVLGEELTILMRQYANKTFYLLDDDGYIFTSRNDNRLTGDLVYGYHREFLRIAGIPFRGKYLGPRIHDWRYTFSVYAFKQMIDSGMDMYVALPILSTYLGHKTIYATEHYVKLALSIFPYIEEKFEGIAEKIFGGMTNEDN